MAGPGPLVSAVPRTEAGHPPATTAHWEREVRLTPPDHFSIPDLSKAAGTLRPLAVERLELLAVYYDAPDLRLARDGVTLRHRSDEGWTLKLPAEAHEVGVVARRVYAVPGPSDVLPEALLERARAWLRRAAPVPVGRLRTERERVRLVDADELTVAEVVCDVAIASRLKGPETIRIREVKAEVRSASACPELLPRLVTRLERAGAVRAPGVPKLVRALGLPPGSSEIHAEPRDATAGEAVRAATARSVRRFLVHDPGLVGGEDPEDVHQARVALRRLRSDLRTFGRVLDPVTTRHLREEAGWFAALLGGVRDADVMRERLAAAKGTLPPADGAPFESLLARHDVERDAARRALLAGRGGERFLDLVEALLHAAEATPTGPLAAAPATEVLPDLVGRRWRRAKAARAALSQDPTDAELHRLRIEAKRVRYAADAAASVSDGRARRLAHAAADLQDVLGEHQDAIVLEAWLRAHAEDAPPSVALAAGEIVMSERVRAERTRGEWRAAWRRLARQGAAWGGAGH